MICTQLKKSVKIYNFQTSSSLAELGPAQPQLVIKFKPNCNIFFNKTSVDLATESSRYV